MKPCWSVPPSSWLQPTLTYISARWCSMLEMAGRIMCQRNCALTGGRERRVLLKVIKSCGELTSSFQASSGNVWSRSYTWHIQEWFVWKLLLTVCLVACTGSRDQKLYQVTHIMANWQTSSAKSPLASLGMANGGQTPVTAWTILSLAMPSTPTI